MPILTVGPDAILLEYAWRLSVTSLLLCNQHTGLATFTSFVFDHRDALRTVNGVRHELSTKSRPAAQAVTGLSQWDLARPILRISAA